MEYRLLGGAGVKVPVLSFGTATFGGATEMFRAWGSTDVTEATRLVDLCLEAGVTMFDTADVYSRGLSEEILGQALAGRRNQVFLSTKGSSRMGDGPNDMGSSRYHITRSVEASLRRLNTDHIDLYYLHAFDALTRPDETLRALEDLVRSGKIGYIGCSNFSGWHLMKSLATSDRYGLPRYAVHQVSYSLLAREYEWELMPLALDQQVGAVVYSPLAGGKLSGKVRRDQPLPKGSRVTYGRWGLKEDEPNEKLLDIVDLLYELSGEVEKTVSQVALNWVLQRPSVASVTFGARTEEQLRENLGATGWNLTPEQVARLDAVSAQTPVYPYSHQLTVNRERIPPAV